MDQPRDSSVSRPTPANSYLRRRSEGERGAVQVLAGSAVATLAAGITLLAVAVLPRIGKGVERSGPLRHGPRPVRRSRRVPPAVQHEAEGADERRLRQLLDLSIVRRKYRLTQTCEVCTGLGFGCVGAAVNAHHLMTG